MLLINEQKIQNLNLSGKGGKESSLMEIFQNLKRESAELYDAVTDDGTRIEFKKQTNTQWFDAGKYHNLKDEDKSILMTFVTVTKQNKKKNIVAGLIENISTISLGDFISILTSKQEHKKDGWEYSNIETCYQQKKKYKTQQAKIKVDIRNFLKQNKKSVNTLWQRQ